MNVPRWKTVAMDLGIGWPVSPMLAKAVPEVPDPDAKGGPYAYEPKWDGFRCIVARDGDEVELGSRGEKPLTRYFPEVVEAVRRLLPERIVVDVELVVRAGELSPRVVNAAPLPAVSSPTSGLADTCPDRPKAPSRLRTPRHSALDGASDAPLTASASAELQACIAAGATSTRTDDERTAQRGQWPRSDALLQMTGVRVSSERRGASTSFRPDPDSRDVFCAKAGCPAAAPTGIQPAATAGFGESRPQEGRFRVGRSNPRRVDQLKQGLPSRRTR